jgi:hypothetical protein
MNAQHRIVKLPEELREAAIRKYSRESPHILGAIFRRRGYRSAKLPRSSISASTYERTRPPTSFGSRAAVELRPTSIAA